jgi:hypothetical protein
MSLKKLSGTGFLSIVALLIIIFGAMAVLAEEIDRIVVMLLGGFILLGFFLIVERTQLRFVGGNHQARASLCLGSRCEDCS